jgi:hypothetical protein
LAFEILVSFVSDEPTYRSGNSELIRVARLLRHAEGAICHDETLRRRASLEPIAIESAGLRIHIERAQEERLCRIDESIVGVEIDQPQPHVLTPADSVRDIARWAHASRVEIPHVVLIVQEHVTVVPRPTGHAIRRSCVGRIPLDIVETDVGRLGGELDACAGGNDV